MVTVRIPIPSSAMVVNLIGVFGLLAVIGAIGALTDWRWALLAAGVFAVGFALAAQNGQPAKAGNVTPIAGQRRKAAG